ncbi:unnamed protein product, partial [Mesorhabditis spiculigera]
MSADYRSIIIVLSLVSAVVGSQSLFAEYDEDERPRVAWVPIVSRNVNSSASYAHRAIQEVNSKDPNKIQRIVKMLNDSYNRMDEERLVHGSALYISLIPVFILSSLRIFFS